MKIEMSSKNMKLKLSYFTLHFNHSNTLSISVSHCVCVCVLVYTHVPHSPELFNHYADLRFSSVISKRFSTSSLSWLFISKSCRLFSCLQTGCRCEVTWDCIQQPGGNHRSTLQLTPLNVRCDTKCNFYSILTWRCPYDKWRTSE